MKLVWGCDWGIGGVPPVKLLKKIITVKMVKLAQDCDWGTGFSTTVKIVRIMKMVKWFGRDTGVLGVYPYSENSETSENGSSLGLGRGLYTTVKIVKKW